MHQIMKLQINMQTLEISLVTLVFLVTLLPSSAIRRPRPVLLLDYACYKPPPHRKCSSAAAEAFLLGGSAVLGEETYAPPFIFEEDGAPTLKCAIQEAKEGIFSAIDTLLAKTLIPILQIDAVIVACGSFSPAPSLSSLVVCRYKLKSDVKTYNLTSMGCSSGVIAVDFAARVLRGGGQIIRSALVVVTESITLNWYGGDSRPMLVTNCIFRVGCAAGLVTNDPSHRRAAKMELVDSLRTHHGADDGAYQADFQEEDDRGKTGISLTKDLVRVAGVNLREHIKILAPRVLPLSQLARYACSTALWHGGLQKVEPDVPDFRKAFEHMCIHTGGKARVY